MTFANSKILFKALGYVAAQVLCFAQNTYTYDSGGHLTKITYGTSGSVVYGYDAAGHLTSRTTAAAGAGSTITSVSTVGAPASAGIAQNTWIEVNGVNLVPATTAASGVIWNSAPSFAQGLLPTQLNGVGVTVNGKVAYVYFYCSAVTDSSCPTDQINVLTPLDSATGSVQIVVTSGATMSAPYSATMHAVVPSFLLFAAPGYVTSTHLNNTGCPGSGLVYCFVGPLTLYPGDSLPAAPGEQIVVYGVGFGLPSTVLTGGSASQSSPLPNLPSCQIGGNPAPVGFAGLTSPGLYQINLTVPSNAATGDNSISCTYNNTTTPAGDLLTVSP